MKYYKILKREDGTQYQIIINCYMDSYGNTSIVYNYTLNYKEKGKKLWKPIPDTLYEYLYRNLSLVDREIHNKENTLRFISKEELLEAKLELWNTFKPTL